MNTMSTEKQNTYGIDNTFYGNYHGFMPTIKTFKYELEFLPESSKFIEERGEIGFIKDSDRIIKLARIGKTVVIASALDGWLNSIKLDSSVITKIVSMWATGSTKKDIITEAKSAWTKLREGMGCKLFTTNKEMWQYVSEIMRDESIKTLLTPFCADYNHCTVDEMYNSVVAACKYIIENQRTTWLQADYEQTMFMLGIDKKNSFKVGSLGFRSLVENTEIFSKNIKLASELIDVPNLDLSMISNTFEFKLTQHYINTYNNVVAATNQAINEYNQINKVRLPKLKYLYKLPGSADDSNDITPSITNDKDLFTSVLEIKNIIDVAEKNIREYIPFLINNPEEIFFAGTHANLSVILGYESRTTVTSIVNEYFENNTHKLPAETKKQYETRLKQIKEMPCDIAFLSTLLQMDVGSRLVEYISNILNTYHDCLNNLGNINIDDYDEDAKHIPTPDYDDVKMKLQKLCSAASAIRQTVKMFQFDDAPMAENVTFDNMVTQTMDVLEPIHCITSNIQRYVITNTDAGNAYLYTANRPTFMAGISESKCADNGNFLFRIEDEMYFGIAPNSNRINVENFLTDKDSSCKFYACMKCDAVKQLPKKYFSASYLSSTDKYWITDEIRMYEQMDNKQRSERLKTDINLKNSVITFFKECLMHDNHDISCYKDANEYKTLSAFYEDVTEKEYTCEYKNVDYAKLMSYVHSGQLYLGKITTRDMKSTHRGKLDNSVLWFKAATDPATMNDHRIQLGLGQVHMVEAKNKTTYPTHAAGTFVKHKTKEGGRTFKFDLIKGRSHHRDKYTISFTYTLNPFAKDAHYALNETVLNDIYSGKINYCVSIDRGETNFAYLTVRELKTAQIVYHESLNVVNGVDYHALITELEAKDLNAQKTWGTRQKGNHMMDGWVSGAVNRTVQIAMKYNAVIAMENLTLQFCMHRKSFCRFSVYSKFKNALITKLSCLYNSKTDFSQILNAYQLTSGSTKDEDNKSQNGILFFVNPQYTSNNDVSTGFITQFIKAKHDTNAQAKESVEQCSIIRFDGQMKTLAITINDIEMYMAGPRMVYANKSRVKSDLRDIALSICNHAGIEPETISKDAIMNAAPAIHKEFARMLSLAKHMRFRDTNEDSIYSIVKNKHGKLFSTADGIAGFPDSADCNGAYCIGLRLEHDLFYSDRFSKDITDTMSWEEFLAFNAERLMK